MQQHLIQFSFDVYQDSNALNSEDATLLNSAKEAIELSHAPYSRFQVGAAARLSNGIILKGSNQENASSLRVFVLKEFFCQFVLHYIQVSPLSIWQLVITIK
jgi:hypothetical protein